MQCVVVHSDDDGDVDCDEQTKIYEITCCVKHRPKNFFDGTTCSHVVLISKLRLLSDSTR